MKRNKKIQFAGKTRYFDTREIDEFDKGDTVMVNLSNNNLFKWEPAMVVDVSDSCIKVSVTDDDGSVKFGIFCCEITNFLDFLFGFRLFFLFFSLCHFFCIFLIFYNKI